MTDKQEEQEEEEQEEEEEEEEGENVESITYGFAVGNKRKWLYKPTVKTIVHVWRREGEKRDGYVHGVHHRRDVHHG